MATEANKSSNKHTVAVLGAGPAGLYAARKLASSGVDVVLVNRDLKPGGLAEYGIYYTKHKMKEGLRKQFRKILAMPNIEYLGGVSVGENGQVTLSQLEQLGFSSVLFAIGAQGTRSLGLPGEEGATGLFHAKDLVYHFNKLPPFATKEFAIGKRVGIIGMGNVMVDVAHWLICDKKVDEVTVIARRGPAERAYTDKEMREIVEALDVEALDRELARIKPRLDKVGIELGPIREEILKPLEKAEKLDSPTRFQFRFLCSTKKLHTDAEGRLCGVEVEENELVERDGTLRPKGLGETTVLDLDTLVFAIGDQVDSEVGLPFEWGQYKVPEGEHPRVPGRARYEVFDADKGVRAGWFLGGWARVASDGLVGKARADGETAAEEVLQYLETGAAEASGTLSEIAGKLRSQLEGASQLYVSKDDVERLESIEREEAQQRGLEFFKFDTDEQMLRVLGKR